MERARILAKEITGTHENARHLIESICHKYLNKDDAKGMGNSQNLRENIEKAFIEIYNISVTHGEINTEQDKRLSRNPEFPYSYEEIASDLLHDKVVNKIKSMIYSDVPLIEIESPTVTL